MLLYRVRVVGSCLLGEDNSMADHTWLHAPLYSFRTLRLWCTEELFSTHHLRIALRRKLHRHPSNEVRIEATLRRVHQDCLRVGQPGVPVLVGSYEVIDPVADAVWVYVLYVPDHWNRPTWVQRAAYAESLFHVLQDCKLRPQALEESYTSCYREVSVERWLGADLALLVQSF